MSNNKDWIRETLEKQGLRKVKETYLMLPKSKRLYGNKPCKIIWAINSRYRLDSEKIMNTKLSKTMKEIIKLIEKQKYLTQTITKAERYAKKEYKSVDTRSI